MLKTNLHFKQYFVSETKQIWGLAMACGPQLCHLCLQENQLLANTWSISGARTQSLGTRLSNQWNPVPLERKGTVVEQGQELGSVPTRARVLLLQILPAQGSGMELEISWVVDCQDLQGTGHSAFSREQFLLSSNHLIISKAM